MESAAHQLFSHFPEIVASAPAALGWRQAILDGEVVVLDAAGRPSFSRRNDGCGFGKPSPQVLRAVPASFYAFDILALDGQDTTALPYLEGGDLWLWRLRPRATSRPRTPLPVSSRRSRRSPRRRNMSAGVSIIA